MKTFVLGILCLLTSIQMMGQYSLRGTVVDENGKSLVGATVVLLDAQDSTLLAFSISNKKGGFIFENVEKQDYILQLSFVAYNNVSELLTFDWTSSELNIGVFTMLPSTKILQEVTIKAEHIPIGIRGDTIVYNTDAFITKPGASVEDLLKKLPGIVVDRSGAIKAQGVDVKKVLVEGKSFFGDDPKMATQNLEAEAINKVEVFDKASDVAEFTGVDDGNDQKTINLKLKEEYKNGGFGKLELEGGTKERYKSKLNYNRFSPSMQAAIIGASNNINEQAFSINDYISFMGGLSKLMSSSNGVINFGEQFSGNARAPEGLNRNTSGGLNFNYDSSDKIKLTSNYFLSNTRVKIDRSIMRQQFVNDLEYNSIESSLVNENNLAHRLNTKLEYHLNPLMQAVFTNNFRMANDENEEAGQSEFMNAFQNSRSSHVFNLSRNQWAYEGAMQWRRKYIKKGRNWISNVGTTLGNVSEDNNVLSEFLIGVSKNVTDQFQKYTKSEKSFKLDTRFTEPVARKRYLSIYYQIGYSLESPEKYFYDREEQDFVINNSLSATFEKQFYYHRAGMSLKNNGRKLKMNVGVDVQQSFLTTHIIGDSEVENSKYFHILPLFSAKYKITNSKTLDFSYSTSVAAPALSQLMPLPDNSDPNLLILGNPNLDAEYQHRVSLGFNYYDQFSFTSFFSNFDINYTKDRIINEVSIEEGFRRTIRPINSDDFLSAFSYMSFGKPIKMLGVNFRLINQIQFSRYETFLNAERSPLREGNITGSLSFDNRKKKYFDIESGIRVNFTKRQYELNEDFNQHFFNYDLYVENDFFLPSNITIGLSYDFRRFSNESFSSNETYNLLNTSIRKDFNDGRWGIQLRGFDLLGQNIGFRRMGGINSLNEVRYNTLSRYFMLGINWSLGKTKKSTILFE